MKVPTQSPRAEITWSTRNRLQADSQAAEIACSIVYVGSHTESIVPGFPECVIPLSVCPARCNERNSSNASILSSPALAESAAGIPSNALANASIDNLSLPGQFSAASLTLSDAAMCKLPPPRTTRSSSLARHVERKASYKPLIVSSAATPSVPPTSKVTMPAF